MIDQRNIFATLSFSKRSVTMSRKHTAVFLAGAVSAALAFAGGFAAAQAKAPTETIGQSAVELRSLDLI
jgi:hypothetical protein